MGSKRELIVCGVCWGQRGAKRVFEDVPDLARHATLKHPGLGFTPVKRVPLR